MSASCAPAAASGSPESRDGSGGTARAGRRLDAERKEVQLGAVGQSVPGFTADAAGADRRGGERRITVACEVMAARRGTLRLLTRVELEARRHDRAPAGEVDRYVHPLPGVEERAIDLPGCAEQSAVGAEQVERNQLPAVTKSHEQTAGVAGVQDLESHPARRHDPLRLELDR